MKCLFCILLLVAIVITTGCIFSSPSLTEENAKDVIKVDTGSSTRTSFVTGTKTIIVQGKFTNTGRLSHNFFGGLSIYDPNFSLEYKGKTMTLQPGESKTIEEIFVVDYSFDFKNVSHIVAGVPL